MVPQQRHFEILYFGQLPIPSSSHRRPFFQLSPNHLEIIKKLAIFNFWILVLAAFLMTYIAHFSHKSLFPVVHIKNWPLYTVGDRWHRAAYGGRPGRNNPLNLLPNFKHLKGLDDSFRTWTLEHKVRTDDAVLHTL